MARFATLRPDGRSLSQVAYDHIVAAIASGDLEPGRIILHAELLDVMETGRDAAYYQAVSAASRRLERSHNRSLRTERRAGYRLVSGTGMSDKAREVDLSRARRATGKGLATLTAIDMQDIPEMSQKQLVRHIRNGFGYLAHLMSQQAEDIARHQEEIEQLKQESATTRRRLDILEQQQQ